jgi:hypothetical protein
LAARIKKHEKLTESNIQHVINLLEAENPITKKEACSILNITYNTTRLNNIIEEHKETIRYRDLRKAQNKGKGVTEAEKKSIVTYYLASASGEPAFTNRPTHRFSHLHSMWLNLPV